MEMPVFDVEASSEEERVPCASVKRRRTEALPSDVENATTNGAVATPTDSLKTEAEDTTVSRPIGVASAVKLASSDSSASIDRLADVARPLRGSQAGVPPTETHESESNAQLKEAQWEGYTLRDLRKVVEAALPRYGHLLTADERASLNSFERLPLRAQQLYARIYGRKWPQWLRLEGLGLRYRELGVENTLAAAADLTVHQLQETATASACVVGDSRGEASNDGNKWLLDTAVESVESLLSRPLDGGSGGDRDSYGTLLLEALPAGELRQRARESGLNIQSSGGRRGAKQRLLKSVCDAARQQRVIRQSGSNVLPQLATAEARLISQALSSGRWVCVAPGPGRSALSMMMDMFHLETSGAPDSSYVVFSSRWPLQAMPSAALASPLFEDRSALDSYLAARRCLQQMESTHERPDAERLSAASAQAEAELRLALEVARASESEAAKLRHRYRRRFTAAWCWADALHHAVVEAPAAGDDTAARNLKIQRLRLLLATRVCISRRGRWYAELAKEVARAESAGAALHVASDGLAEGESPPVAVRVTVDLTDDQPTQELELPMPLLPRDARWDLARRCRSLAAKAAVDAAPGCKESVAARAWQKQLRISPAAQAKAAESDDGGRWLPALVLRLVAEESQAAGQVRSISAGSLALPQAPADGKTGRRLFDAFDFQELTVEELAMKHYLGVEGFSCGIHCEGALLRDLFGLLLYDELFDTTVNGVFASSYQDAPLDLGTEDFYGMRTAALERRFAQISAFSPVELASEVRSRFSAYWGTRIRGVRWDRYDGPSGGFLREGNSQSVAVSSKPAARAHSDANAVRQRHESHEEPEVLSSSEEDGQSSRKTSRAHCETEGDPDVAKVPSSSSKPETATSAKSGSSMHRRILWVDERREICADSCDLGAVAGAVGGQALTAALRLLCEDYNSAGLPDLLLWQWDSNGSARARFVEVKSERDKLSRRQKLWLSTLRGGGAEAEVCHVRDAKMSAVMEDD